MKSVAAVLGVVVAAVLAVAVWGISTYNGFVGRQEAVNAAWSQVQNVYQRRADLVPNLVATVQGAANFEKSTLTAVTEARASVAKMTVDKSVLDNPEAFHKFEAAQGQLGSALSRLLVVIEKYPDLKANQNFRDLQVQLEGTENRITVERRDFNSTAQGYNTAIRKIPANFVASMGHFSERPYFQADETAQKAPQVKF
jgi:LemA protein